MGKLIKNHLARLIILVSATYHLAASIHCFLWPKVLWDNLTNLLTPAVKPVPILQTLSLISALSVLCLDYPFPSSLIAGSGFHKSFEFRLLGLYPIAALLSALIYQGTEAAGFYIIGMAIWFWAYAEGEVICEKPWMLPKKGGHGGEKVGAPTGKTDAGAGPVQMPAKIPTVDTQIVNGNEPLPLYQAKA